MLNWYNVGVSKQYNYLSGAMTDGNRIEEDNQI